MTERKASGQITVFLSLLLMILISFLCTAVRSAQTAGSRYLFTLTTEAVARSMFGAYDTRLWEQYRILALTDQKLAQEIGDQCGDSYEKNGTLFPLEITSVQLSDLVTLTDRGAAAWEASAVSYMEARLPVDVVSGLLEQVGLLDGLENMMDWMSNLRDLIQPLIRLEKKLCQLEDKLEQAVETYQRGKALLKELQDCCALVSELIQQGDGMDTAAFDEAWAALEKHYVEIQEYLRESGWKLDEITQDAAENLDSAEDLANQIGVLLESMVAGDQWGLSSLADLGGYLSGLTERVSFLQDLPNQLAQLREYLQRISQMTLPAKEEVLSGVGQEALAFLQGLAEGFVGEVWQPDQMEVEEGTQEDEQKAGILVQLKDWLDQGVLALVLDDVDQVSQASLGRALERSQRQEEPEERNASSVSEISCVSEASSVSREGSVLDTLDDAYRSVLYGEYALRYTSAYGQKAGAGLQYETEHLIAGKGQDAANLAAVASRLLLVRGAMNFLYLLQTMENNEAVQLTAAGISAALGGWVPQGLVSIFLMVVWAMAEAVCDVRALLAGKRVPFWKDAASWKLAFEHLWTVLDDGFLMGLDRQTGMTYEEYLRLFLFLVPTEEKCYRTMEVAEENLRKERDGFRIDQAIYRADVTVDGHAAGQKIQLSLEYGY